MRPGPLRGLMAVVAVALLAYGGSSLARVIQMKREVERLERDIATLRDETGRLTRTIDRLRTDPEFIEQLARESLGLVKPGEKVLKLPPSTPGG
ncbi:MAG TPA: septum formation initiator family protein [Methylomirabilota bacterium]|nr:septum formation initiator family protein [Methylomirabilota bacterium]